MRHYMIITSKLFQTVTGLPRFIAEYGQSAGDPELIRTAEDYFRVNAPDHLTRELFHDMTDATVYTHVDAILQEMIDNGESVIELKTPNAVGNQAVLERTFSHL